MKKYSNGYSLFEILIVLFLLTLLSVLFIMNMENNGKVDKYHDQKYFDSFKNKVILYSLSTRMRILLFPDKKNRIIRTNIEKYDESLYYSILEQYKIDKNNSEKYNVKKIMRFQKKKKLVDMYKEINYLKPYKYGKNIDIYKNLKNSSKDFDLDIK